jgi:hypothetical protein
MSKSVFLLCGGPLLCACAATPDVQMSYYLPKASMSLKAIRTVGCGKDGILYSTTDVVPTTSYSRDDGTLTPLYFQSTGGTFSNADLAVKLADDGRLLGINVTTEGQGEDILKAVAPIVGMILPGGAFASSLYAGHFPVPPELAAEAACKSVKDHGDKGVLTLTYLAEEKFEPKEKSSKQIELAPGSADYAYTVDRALDPLFLNVSASQPVRLPVGTSSENLSASLEERAHWQSAIADWNGTTILRLRQPASVPVCVSAKMGTDCKNAEQNGRASSDAPVIWSAAVLVPQRGENYPLPIPKGAQFGSQVFALALSDAGTITTLQYAKKGGAAGVLSGVGAGLGAYKPQSAEDKANELKGEADLIAQQQRLIRCQLDNKSCT